MWQAQISYRRRLKLEKLTGRCALAIDIAPHNEFIPEDVNCDLQIDADDAQAVFRLLESRDSRSILRDDSIDLPESLRWDVNDDNLLSATDALLIVNRLHGEGENSKVMQVTLQATKIDGSALPKIGGVITVGQGEKILVKMSTKDLRTSPLGVAAAYVDLTYTSGLMQVNMRENQLITINGGPAGGSFTLTITNPTTNVSQTTGSITYDPLDASVTRNNIRNALVALDNVALGEVAVEAPPKSSVLDHRNNVVVRFGGRFSNVNVPTMTADFSSLIGGTNPSISVSELSGTNPVDPRDFLRSITFGSTFRDVISANNGGVVPNMIDEVGAVNFNQWMGQEVLVYEFEATVLSRGNLLLQLEPADVLPAHNLLLHGRNDAVTPVEVLFGDLNLRVLSPDDRSGWQNASNFMDVNNDGEITSSDALLVINYLNDRSNDRYLPNTASVAPPFLDTDGNKRVSANDALQIINFLNNRP